MPCLSMAAGNGLTGPAIREPGGQDRAADAVFGNGNVITLDPARPGATTLALLGGRLLAVGDEDDLSSLTPGRRIDLAGSASTSASRPGSVTRRCASVRSRSSPRAR